MGHLVQLYCTNGFVAPCVIFKTILISIISFSCFSSYSAIFSAVHRSISFLWWWSGEHTHKRPPCPFCSIFLWFFFLALLSKLFFARCWKWPETLVIINFHEKYLYAYFCEEILIHTDFYLLMVGKIEQTKWK